MNKRICWALSSCLLGFVRAVLFSFEDTLAQDFQSVLIDPFSKTDAEHIAEGKALAKYHCALCHKFTAPDLLDRQTWIGQVLPRMRIRMGMAALSVEMHPEVDWIKATGQIPTKPMLSEAEFESIVRYYAAHSPKRAIPQTPRPPIRTGMSLFKVDRRAYRRSNPSVTLLRYEPKIQRILLGHADQKQIELLDGDLKKRDSILIGNIPTGFALHGEDAFVTAIGSFLPSDRPRGELIHFSKTSRGYVRKEVLLDKLRRPTETQIADINGDGRADFVIASFGNLSGSLDWYEKDEGKFIRHKIFEQAGALRPALGDFNGDGFVDIAVLVAQNWEMFFIFNGDGKGQFSGNVAFHRHPLFGHSSFELVDFNGDGLIDILTTNGDNGEYPSPLKRFHGIRIYLNQGENRFEERFFFPMNGAFQAIGRDFDQDGDVDIAATSFFPDYAKSPQESFIYLENLGDLTFSPLTFSQCLAGRWLRLDAGDIDGDGDLDLLLGSYIHGPGSVPEGLKRAWEAKGPSLMVLRNQLKTP